MRNKTNFIFWIIIFILLFAKGNVYWVDFSNINSKETSCPVSNTSDVIYIPNWSNSFTTKISDVFWANTD